MKIKSKLIGAFNSPCQVIEISKTQGIYPIFKNAKSSLQHWASDNKLMWVNDNNIKKLNLINIFLREPQERFISGIHTHIWQNNLENNIDEILINIKNIKIINKHFIPQYYWILHLSKYFTGIIKLQSYLEILKITTRREGPWTKMEKKWKKLDNTTKEKIEKHIPQEYLKLDNELYSKFLNKTINIKKIIDYFHALP